MKQKKHFNTLIIVAIISFAIVFFGIHRTFAAIWTERTILGSHAWFGVASSADGSKLAAVDNGNYIYTSSDFGASWQEHTSTGPQNWFSIASSADGTKLAAGSLPGSIYTSDDSGATWVVRISSIVGGWTSIASSADGTKLAATDNGGYIYTSTDSGAHWTQQTASGTRNWWAIASSADGTKLVAVATGNYIYTSNNSGVTWNRQDNAGSREWVSITSSSDGVNLAAVESSGGAYISNDSGLTWTHKNIGSTTENLRTIASSADGTKLIVGSTNSPVYTSSDSGDTWVAESISGSIYGVASSADGENLVAVKSYPGHIYTAAPDISSPIITNISSSTGNGTYGVDDTILIDIDFDEIVNVTGIPQLTLETGSFDSIVNYVSGSGSQTLVFSYRVGPGEISSDLDYININALALNGGTIRDAFLNDAILTLPVPGNSGSLSSSNNIIINTSLVTPHSSGGGNNFFFPPPVHSPIMPEITPQAPANPETLPVIPENLIPSEIHKTQLPLFKKFIHLNHFSDEVKNIKVFLNEEMNASLDTTSKLDLYTFKVIKTFQLKYSEVILSPWGISEPTGFWGPTTTRQANKLLGYKLKKLLLPNGTILD